MPVYNAEKYLDNVLTDIINQTYKNWELICVNDGSEDKSFEILNKYSKENENVSVLTIPNGGCSKARNMGLAYASGDYIRFIDADDRMPADSVEIMVNAMEKNDLADIVIGNYNCYPKASYFQGELLEEGLYSGKEFAELFIKSVLTFYIGAVWNKLYRRCIISNKNLCFKEGINWCEDYFFNLEYFNHCNNFYLINDPNGVYDYYDTPDSITSKLDDWGQDKIDEIDKIRAEAAIIFCRRFGLEEKFDLCWRFKDLYSGVSTMVKQDNVSILEKYKDMKERLKQPGIREYIELKRAEDNLLAWKILDYSTYREKYVTAFTFFYLKGRVAKLSEKYNLGIREKVKRKLPNGF